MVPKETKSKQTDDLKQIDERAASEATSDDEMPLQSLELSDGLEYSFVRSAGAKNKPASTSPFRVPGSSKNKHARHASTGSRPKVDLQALKNTPLPMLVQQQQGPRPQRPDEGKGISDLADIQARTAELHQRTLKRKKVEDQDPQGKKEQKIAHRKPLLPNVFTILYKYAESRFNDDDDLCHMITKVGYQTDAFYRKLAKARDEKVKDQDQAITGRDIFPDIQQINTGVGDIHDDLSNLKTSPFGEAHTIINNVVDRAATLAKPIADLETFSNMATVDSYDKVPTAGETMFSLLHVGQSSAFMVGSYSTKNLRPGDHTDIRNALGVDDTELAERILTFIGDV